MPTAVEITTGSRLHFGPLAVGCTRGRSFGGIGLMVQEPALRLRAAAGDVDRLRGSPELVERIAEVLRRVRSVSELPLPSGLEVELGGEIPLHQGFGGGTQLALAVAQGLCGAQVRPAKQLARWSGRGLRSAIGVHGFATGGFLVDAGKQTDRELGTPAVRMDFPPEWPLLLWSPRNVRGLSGQRELAALERLPPMTPALTDRLCGIVLRELLPALVERNAEEFSRALGSYGDLVGEYFAPVQQGRFADPGAVEAVEWLAQRGIRGVAQSSWGPTLAVVLPDAAVASEMQRAWPFTSGTLRITHARNTGADVIPASG